MISKEKLDEQKKYAIKRFQNALDSATEMLREWREENKIPKEMEIELLSGNIAFTAGELCGICGVYGAILEREIAEEIKKLDTETVENNNG